jgi:hypothetical protein
MPDTMISPWSFAWLTRPHRRSARHDSADMGDKRQIGPLPLAGRARAGQHEAETSCSHGRDKVNLEGVRT